MALWCFHAYQISLSLTKFLFYSGNGSDELSIFSDVSGTSISGITALDNAPSSAFTYYVLGAGEGGEAVTGTGASSSSASVPGEDQPKITGSTLSAGDGSPSTKGGGGKLTDI